MIGVEAALAEVCQMIVRKSLGLHSTAEYFFFSLILVFNHS